jgi:hypothetical protein
VLYYNHPRNQGENKMDYLKKATCVDYTAWDLNCPRYVHPKDRQIMEAKFKRKARRKDKENLKKFLTK